MNDNPNVEKTESQAKRIFKFMKEGGIITDLEALKMFDCRRLASRICDIRNTHPEENIRKKMIKLPSGKYVAQYFISQN